MLCYEEFYPHNFLEFTFASMLSMKVRENSQFTTRWRQYHENVIYQVQKNSQFTISCGQSCKNVTFEVMKISWLTTCCNVASPWTHWRAWQWTTWRLRMVVLGAARRMRIIGPKTWRGFKKRKGGGGDRENSLMKSNLVTVPVTFTSVTVTTVKIWLKMWLGSSYSSQNMRNCGNHVTVMQLLPIPADVLGVN